MPGEIRITPSQWPEHLAAAEGPQLVVGGPGTGKTEFLVRRGAHLIDGEICAPEHLLILTFSRRGAAELQRRMLDRLARTLRGIDTSTYHSFAMRLLETHAARLGWRVAPTVLTGPDQLRLVASLLATERTEDWSPAYRGLLETSTFAAEVTDFLLRCREQLVTPEALEEMTHTHHEWIGLPSFLSRYDAALRHNGLVDYSTLLAEAVHLLRIPDVAEQTRDQYRYVLVDEFQDTTTAQAALLRALTAGRDNLTVAADPYQSIYSFRGAQLENVERFPDTFRDGKGNPAVRIVLTTSHRVPEAILDAAVRVTAHELPGAAGPVVAAAGAGSVETYRFEQQTEEAEWIASELSRLHLEQQLPYRRMAVFVRTKRRFISDLSRALERRGVPHDRPDARLVDAPAVRFVHDLVLAATEEEGPAETGRAVRRLLLGPFVRLSLSGIRELERAKLRTGRTWAEVIRSQLPACGALASFLEDTAWVESHPAVDGLWKLWEAMPEIAPIASDPGMREHAAAWSAYAAVLERWRDRMPTGTLAAHRRLVEDETFEATPLLSHVAADEDRVTITTLHQSKGLEFDVVFIADAVEGVFPDLRARDSLLGTRRLNPGLPPDQAGYLAFRMAEERRLAYTAMTRATKRVVWTATATGYEEGSGIPSRFLALAADGEPRRPLQGGEPITALEIEAWLRRIASDPFAPPTERRAAIAVLAHNGGALRPADTYFGMRSRGPDRGIVPSPVRLSPSQAEAYERCPRSYALERRLGIGDETTVHAAFGSLVHEVLERAERAARDEHRQRSTIEEAIALFDELFDPADYGGGPYADAWRRRGIEALTNLYDGWPSSRPLVDVERTLTAEVGGTAWLGRADRIEGGSGGTVIVDYKTSKSGLTVGQAAESLQLGFYMLAAAADPEITAAGRVVGAEMWYPLMPLKRSITVRSFDPANLENIEERMIAVADGIRSEHWPATPNPLCDRCRVRSSCPAWPHGREAFSS